MGKGSRSRLNRLQAEIDNPAQAEKKAKEKKTRKNGDKTTFIMLAIVIVVVVAILTALTLSLLSNNGVFLRNQTVLKSDHYKVDAAMMTYYLQFTYENWYSSYQQLMSNFSFKTGATWKSQEFGSGYESMYLNHSENVKTWFDYFAELSLSNAQTLLVYAEAAVADPDFDATLTEDDRAEIQQAVDSVKSVYEYYKSYYDYINEMYGTNQQYYSSYKAYLAGVYGKGVNDKDIYRMQEIQHLASKYYNWYYDKSFDGIKADETGINAYLAEHEKSYVTTDYLSYVFSAEKTTVQKTDYETDEEYNAAVAEANEKFAEDKAKAIENAAALAATTTPEEYKAWLEAYLTETLTPGENETIKDLVKDRMDRIETKDHTCTTTNEQDCWMFGYVYDPDLESGTEPQKTEAAAVNSVKTIEADKEDSYKATVYMLTRAADVNKEKAKTFEMVLFPKTYKFPKGEDTEETVDAETAAKTFKEAFEGSTKTMEEVLNELKYTSASYIKLEDVLKGECAYTGTDDWAYSGVDVGTVDLIDSSYTSSDSTTEFYTVIKLLSESYETWYLKVANAMIDDHMTNWFEESKTATTVTINEAPVWKITK